MDFKEGSRHFLQHVLIEMFDRFGLPFHAHRLTIGHWQLISCFVQRMFSVRWAGILTRKDQDFLPGRCNLQEKSGSLQV